jgi:hypothetical protein
MSRDGRCAVNKEQPAFPGATQSLKTQMIRPKKPGKTLERIAREIRDSDEFVAHVGSISQRYRAEHALEAGPGKTAVRQSLRVFHKHADALAGWLRQAQKSRAPDGEREALEKIGAALHEAHHWHSQTEIVTDWLTRTSVAASVTLNAEKSAPKNSPRAAPRVVAEALRATFEFHKLKLSAQVSAKKLSDAVRLLCAIAKDAGDVTLTAQDARQALLESSGSNQSSRLKK